jgi:hypothetical protein
MLALEMRNVKDNDNITVRLYDVVARYIKINQIEEFSRMTGVKESILKDFFNTGIINDFDHFKLEERISVY